MILSDKDLDIAMRLGALSVIPLAADAIQPASIDLRLGDEFVIFDVDRYNGEVFAGKVDPFGPERKGPLTRKLRASAFKIEPGEFMLAHTLENVRLGPELVARIEGRSTLGRLGLIVHATAGFVDPGWEGQLTLEMYNASPNTIVLREGMPIAQLAVQRLSSPCVRPYGDPSRKSKYKGQTGAVEAKPLREGRG
jgi:dCTP deaminase